MSNAAPPAWVLALPLKSGEWRFLSRAWGYGPWGNSSLDAPPLALASVRVKACNATIGARSGQTPGAAAKQASKLCKLGWARRNDDNTLTLAAWGWPGVFELDVAVEHGLVLREDDGNLSWPLTPQGETGHPPQGAPTPQGSPPAGLDPTPHREGPPTPQEPSHPPQGAQSCLSCSCPTSELEVEARDLHGLDAMTWPEPDIEAARQHAAARASAQALLDREVPWGETRQSVSDHAWAAKVRAASESAHYHLDQSDGPAPSYGGLMTQARANYGDEGVLEVLRAWELDGARPTRPPANKLWWRSWAPWVETVLDIKPPEVKPQAESPFAFHPSPELTVVGSMT